MLKLFIATLIPAGLVDIASLTLFFFSETLSGTHKAVDEPSRVRIIHLCLVGNCERNLLRLGTLPDSDISLPQLSLLPAFRFLYSLFPKGHF